jgi:hypothetical protein
MLYRQFTGTLPLLWCHFAATLLPLGNRPAGALSARYRCPAVVLSLPGHCSVAAPSLLCRCSATALLPSLNIFSRHKGL